MQKTTNFVIQKYIENPMLIHNRKFDIRMWVLITQEMDCFLFKEGYIRTSSTAYAIDPSNVDNKYVHLTNNAIQKYSKSYGSFEDGNQMSFLQFQEYLNCCEIGKKVNFARDIMPRIKKLVKDSLLAARSKINPENRKFCFEIFGYDFILDSDANAWLIEVNTNPCLEESSNLLKALLPRMIDNALNLTVDIAFPPLPQFLHTKAQQPYYVQGYSDSINLWYKLKI